MNGSAMEMAPPVEEALRRHGYALIEDVPVDSLDESFDSLVALNGSRRISPNHGLVHRLLGHPAVRDMVSKTLGPNAKPVRAIAFDKTGKSNWSVPWHQDRTIAVDRRIETADVRNWTVKSNTPHCEPPVRILKGMLTLRWHLDTVGLQDGCLRVLPESHRLGRLTSPAIASLLSETLPQDLPASGGTVLVMYPLLVHSSRKRTTSGRRRVLHVELASGNPPSPLRWACAQ